MDFFELKAFVSVAKNLHFARAANEINLSPSALSRLISRLEEETGAELFDRRSKDIFLTEKGRKFLGFASKCVEEKENLVNEFSQIKDLPALQEHASWQDTDC